MQTTHEAPVAEPHSISEPIARQRGGAPLAIEGLRHSFGELQVLAGLDLAVAPREVIGIVGPSGCGKSTLLELIAGLREPSAGRITVGGADRPDGRLAGCAYMPQRDLLLPWLSAIDNAALAPRRCSSASASPGSRTRDRTSCRAGCGSESRFCAR
jgi:ABC-type nitrate/sulfonate/bicarbonate transport system ATPase subunit